MTDIRGKRPYESSTETNSRPRTGRMLQAIVGLFMIVICANPVLRAQSADYHFLHGHDFLQDRNAYLLTLLEKNPTARSVLAGEKVLGDLGRRLTAARETAFSACKDTRFCTIEPMMLTPSEVENVGNILARLSGKRGALNRIVQDHMRPSGRFQKYAELDDAAMMTAAWTDAANGINRLYRIYALDEAFFFSFIDGPLYSLEAETNGYSKAVLWSAALGAEIDESQDELFFTPWSRFGFDLLVINQRAEAARYEPLEEGENAPACARSRSLNWKAWRYTAIVVPGVGLTPSETGVSPIGSTLVRMAARRWHQGFAPFIIVSGGHVHPDRTPFSEAVEMRRVLLAQYDVPKDAVVIEPYARHTGQNLRNSIRLLFRMGAPMNAPFLITSTASGVEIIKSAEEMDGDEKYFGYRPFEDPQQISRFDLAVRPNLTALHADMKDPLDP